MAEGYKLRFGEELDGGTKAAVTVQYLPTTGSQNVSTLSATLRLDKRGQSETDESFQARVRAEATAMLQALLQAVVDGKPDEFPTKLVPPPEATDGKG